MSLTTARAAVGGVVGRHDAVLASNWRTSGL
jgi:hypothetical protein